MKMRLCLAAHLFFLYRLLYSCLLFPLSYAFVFPQPVSSYDTHHHSMRKSLVDLDIDFSETSNYHDGSIKFLFSEHRSDTKKGTIVYLPGIDFTSLGISQYYPDMMEHYDIHAFVIEDEALSRLDYSDVHSIVGAYLSENLSPDDRNTTTICGESMGGLIALNHAPLLSDISSRMILLNPAISHPYDSITDSLHNDGSYLLMTLKTVLSSSKNNLNGIGNAIEKVKEGDLVHMRYLLYMLHNIATTTRMDLSRRLSQFIRPGIEFLDSTLPQALIAHDNWHVLLVVGTLDPILHGCLKAQFLRDNMDRVDVLELEAGHMITRHTFDLLECIEKGLT
jgi:pimeloyl-ACP methyl ester carboxylesterase